MPTFAFSGGVATVPGYGQNSFFQFIPLWGVGDSWSIAVTATEEGDFTLGKGRISGLTAVALKTLANRVYLAAGSSFYFSDNVDPVNGSGPIEWEEQGLGADQIPFVSQYGAQDTVIGFASQQGRLAVFGRYSIQIWAIDSDPSNFSRVQVLVNIGCRNALTIQPLGDLDVLFLDDSGIRSLHTKEVNLNADPVDIGSAIDSLIVAQRSSFSTACAIVEPVSKRYWVCINGTIYVLSYFRANKIVAWSTYIPSYMLTLAPTTTTYNLVANGDILTFTGLTAGKNYYWTPGANEIVLNVGAAAYTTTTTFAYSGGSVTVQGIDGTSYTGTLIQQEQVTFTPTKMIVYNGTVYIRDSDNNLHTYTDNSYDNCQATITTPYLDDKRPAEVKYMQAVDVAMSGAWTISLGSDPASDSYQSVYASGSGTSPSMKIDSSFDYERAAYTGIGTHFSFKAVSSAISQAKATIGAFLLHYNKGGQS